MGDEFQTADLRCFTSTVRAGSITRAAAALGLSQPAVSQRIQRLERAAGERLLIRDPTGVRPTPAGETLLAYAERMLTLHDEARSALGGQGEPATGRRTIGLLEDLAVTTLPATLADYAALHPRIELEVVVTSAARLRRMAEQGRLDLVFGDPSVMPSVRWRRRTPLCWAAAPGLDLAADPLPLVLFSPPCSWRQPVLDALSRHGREWRVAFQSTSLPAVQAAISAGLGLGALLPDNLPVTAGRVTGHLPPAPAVDIVIARRPGTDGDSALNTLERLLQRAAGV
ncbi:LysR family transcriptional regulator [Nonomuraea roseoviolacea]|uniref:DNA-binding transcriptional LysR family regulator n=1 Tax=Nonomuraea roseoviolacea subsp. carminata TaxID=160689 RepID=A0ABT1K252_9ACTN|nr:LysR substrate-binding domain-containing protein [Nonomuraea roseoviolacea]MCP2348071.1 DNA-binding transcriptional LysR family regulator [Nonomuraea roseoviolacea subsp. carminata]